MILHSSVQRKQRQQAGATPTARKPASRTLSVPMPGNRQMLNMLAARAIQRQPVDAQQLPKTAAPPAHAGQTVTATEAAPVPPAQMTKEQRMAYVMGLLIEKYAYPETGAAGLVGNLYVESKGLLPNIIEDAKADSPMKAVNAQGKMTEFTPEEVMNRKDKVRGPKKPGVGIAQWTTSSRRAGLFQHKYNGAVLGAAILNNLDAQVDYLVKELQSQYKGVNKLLQSAKSVEEASDEVVFNFERPGALLQDKTDAAGQTVYKTKRNKKGEVVDVLDEQGQKKPQRSLRSRTDPAVQNVLQKRRRMGQEALAAYRAAKGKPAPSP